MKSKSALTRISTVFALGATLGGCASGAGVFNGPDMSAPHGMTTNPPLGAGAVPGNYQQPAYATSQCLLTRDIVAVTYGMNGRPIDPITPNSPRMNSGKPIPGTIDRIDNISGPCGTRPEPLVVCYQQVATGRPTYQSGTGLYNGSVANEIRRMGPVRCDPFQSYNTLF